MSQEEQGLHLVMYVVFKWLSGSK